tara:strand:- start:2051 stop:3013 length:963 start_codon:yes stop_codon:yes gene_type:complete
MSDLIYIVGYADIDLKKPNDYKVGKSNENNMQNRLSGLQTASPHKLEMYATFSISDPSIEKQCHYELEQSSYRDIKRSAGEWFNGKLKTINEIVIKTISRQEKQINNNNNPNYLKLLNDLQKEHSKCDLAEQSLKHNFLMLCKALRNTTETYVVLKDQEKNLKKKVEELEIYDASKYEAVPRGKMITSEERGFLDWMTLLHKMNDPYNIEIVNDRLRHPNRELTPFHRFARIDICCLDENGGEIYRYYPREERITWDTPPSNWDAYIPDNEIVGGAIKKFNSKIDQKFSDKPEYELEIDESFKEKPKLSWSNARQEFIEE